VLQPAAWGQQHHKQQQQLSAAVRSCQLLSAAAGDAGAQQQVEVLRQQRLLQPQTLQPGGREATWQQQQQQMLQQQQILQQQMLQQPQMLQQHHHPQHGSQPQVPRLAGGIFPDVDCGTRGAVLAFFITPFLFSWTIPIGTEKTVQNKSVAPRRAPGCSEQGGLPDRPARGAHRTAGGRGASGGARQPCCCVITPRPRSVSYMGFSI
jgi:hypothetical protein